MTRKKPKLNMVSLAEALVKGRAEADHAREQLLFLMDSNEHFDFKVGAEWYRCRKMPGATRHIPQLNYVNKTFTIVPVKIKPSIRVQKIRERKGRSKAK